MDGFDLSDEQQKALDLLLSGENVFLTGPAGSGKSTVVREFVKQIDPKTFPVLASTGAAAVLVGGRTFHSFFGLGIMEGGAAATIDKALQNKRVVRRLQKIEGVIIDEVSMLSGETLSVAEEITRRARSESLLPWGGMRVIAVGDFAQLPPVQRGFAEKDWAFRNPVWARSGFLNCYLSQNHRSQQSDFLKVLGDVREGNVTERVRDFLSSREQVFDGDNGATRLFPRRNQTEQYNLSKLSEIDAPLIEVKSEYHGRKNLVDRLKKQSPVPEVLRLKQGALVMMRQNDPKQRWVNGSLAYFEEIAEDKMILQLISNNRIVSLEKSTFSQLDAEGAVLAAVVNYPVSLAYGATIHKAQGMTLDAAVVDVSSLWEPGQAYVALSRVTHPDGLSILGWDDRSIKADDTVTQFYSMM